MNDLKHDTDKAVVAACELLATPEGVQAIFQEMLIDEKDKLRLQAKEELFERMQAAWDELVDARKDASLDEVKKMIETLKRMGVDVSGSVLGLEGIATSLGIQRQEDKEPKKQRMVWFMTPDGDVGSALDNTLGGWMSEEVKAFVKPAQAKLKAQTPKVTVSRSSFLVKGAPENADLVESKTTKLLTKEEFIAKVEELGIAPTK
ncbi:MAG: hypothetical protein ACRC2N_02160 [Aeromonas sp.]